ncbi:hypothetical protein ABW20_dc0104725 [Dactylellina cionopaga]|nr:hypothetical protein ABW20_dc0104725 [Dactylellina cionopaga]
MTSRPSNHERNPPSTSHTKKKAKKKKKSSNPNDDTPKAFTRLMAFAATGKRPNGLDDPKEPSANKNPKKRKHSETVAAGDSATTSSRQKHNEDETSTDPNPTQPLTLLPNEKFSDFSRRVDAAIPVSFKGLRRGEDNAKDRKKKKKKEDEKKDGEEEEEVTEDMYDFDDNGDPLPNHLKPHKHRKTIASSAAGKKGNRRSPSPFSILREKRGVLQTSINDVVQAPPSLVVPKEKLKDKTKEAAAAAAGAGGAGIQGLAVPKSSGSLARREMLEVERNSVVERYRALMAAKSGGV